jgi:hypothetical protein
MGVLFLPSALIVRSRQMRENAILNERDKKNVKTSDWGGDGQHQ